MPIIDLDPYDAGKAGQQGHNLSKLVNSERDLLEIVQPDTLRRYRNRFKSAKSVGRIAASQEVHAFIVRKSHNHLAIGQATIIADQKLIHPRQGLFEGYDLDYWIKPSEAKAYHGFVASSLIGHAVSWHNKRFSKNEYDQPEKLREINTRPKFNAIATIIDNHPNPAIGFELVMARIGEPASLTPGTPNDPYQVARGGKTSQLYSFHSS
jgi:hypothetical protein